MKNFGKIGKSRHPNIIRILTEVIRILPKATEFGTYENLANFGALPSTKSGPNRLQTLEIFQKHPNFTQKHPKFTKSVRNLPKPSETYPNRPKSTKSVRNLPKPSEIYPKASEIYPNTPKFPEKHPKFTLVRIASEFSPKVSEFSPKASEIYPNCPKFTQCSPTTAPV